MLKPQLIEAIAEESGLTKHQAGEALTAILDQITDQLSVGNRISVSGLGSFHVRHSEARQAVNPQTREKLHIPARERVVFHAARQLKDAVNEPD